MAAVKDLSTLSLLSNNLNNFVSNQFRNDLNTVNVQKQVAKKQAVNSAINDLTTGLQSPNIEMRNLARTKTVSTLAQLGENDAANAIEKTMEKPDSFVSFEGKQGGDYGVINTRTGEFIKHGTNPMVPKEPSHKDYTVKADGKSVTRSLTPEEVNQYADQGVPVTPIPVQTALISQAGATTRNDTNVGLKSKSEVLGYVADQEEAQAKAKTEIAETEAGMSDSQTTPEQKIALQKIVDAKNEEISVSQKRVKAQKESHPDYFKDGKKVTTKKAPQSAVDYLKKNNTPEMQKAFQDKYGYLP